MDNQRVRDLIDLKIAYSIFEDKEKMKQKRIKKIVMCVCFGLLVVGSSVGVDAASGGKIGHAIKNQVFVMLGEDGQQLKGTEYTDKNGDVWVKVENKRTRLEFNKTVLEKNNMKIKEKTTKDGAHIIIDENKK